MDPVADAYRAAREHVEACERWMFVTDSLPLEDWPKQPANAPYCGCDTCVTREALYAAVPVIERHFRRDNRRLFWVSFATGCLWAWFWAVIGVLAYVVAR